MATEWQGIESAPKDGTLIIGALIRDGKVWRVHDMKHNGLAFYTVNGGSLPRMTHWMPLPAAPAPEGLCVGRSAIEGGRAWASRRALWATG